MARNSNQIFKQIFANVTDSDTRMASVTPFFLIGTVINHKDPEHKKRIKVRINSLDNELTVDTIPWCEPLTTNMLHYIPLEGEYVIVLLQNPWNFQEGRFYIGPIGE